ncbi:MAG: HigA family addiction module antitoxin [Chloroflexi bacterium]|nr:HigA family addiction module antitoxin [Chloroflexota bacterium]
MPMHDPPHPGEAVLGLCLEPFDLSIADAAAHLEVDAEYLAELCAGQEQITADLAIRLEQAFGGTADNWMRVQAAYDLAQTRLKSEHIQIRPIGSAA